MQRLEVSSAVRPIYGSLGVKRLRHHKSITDFFSEVRHPRCVGSITKNFLCITHTVEHNYISPSSIVGIRLHVSALYVGHLQVVI